MNFRLSALRNSKSCIVILVFSISLFFYNSWHVTHAQSVAGTNSGCNVKIIGGSPNMYPGQFVSLMANVTGGIPLSYMWTAEGPIIKDYDDNVYNSTHLTAFLNLDSSHLYDTH